MRVMKRRSATFYAVSTFVFALITSLLACSYLDSVRLSQITPHPADAAPRPAERPLSERVPADMRAFAIPRADLRASVTVRSGDYIDVLATLEPGTSGFPETLTVLDKRRVLEVDSAGDITVLVAPDEAERLAFSLANGKVAVALCSPDGTR